MRKIIKGLKPGDKVVRIGLQKVRHGSPVAPADLGSQTKTAAEMAGESEADLLLSDPISQDKKGN